MSTCINTGKKKKLNKFLLEKLVKIIPLNVFNQSSWDQINCICSHRKSLTTKK